MRHLRHARPLAALLIALLPPASGAVARQPSPATRSASSTSPVVVNLQSLPWTHRQPRWTVVVRTPLPDVRALGGSGGSMYEIEVIRSGQPAAVFVVQAIGLALMTVDESRPTIEVWSAAGGGIYTRAMYRWQAGPRRFCATTVDEFEDHGDEQAAEGVVRIAGNERLVRYARSRPFGCE